jgi:hypothetical protein
MLFGRRSGKMSASFALPTVTPTACANTDHLAARTSWAQANVLPAPFEPMTTDDGSCPVAPASPSS